MEVMLIVGLFASSALSLNFIVNQKYKLAGSMNIINLCLVVRFLLKKKKKEKQQSIENKVVDVDVVDKEN